MRVTTEPLGLLCHAGVFLFHSLLLCRAVGLHSLEVCMAYVGTLKANLNEEAFSSFSGKETLYPTS